MKKNCSVKCEIKIDESKMVEVSRLDTRIKEVEDAKIPELTAYIHDCLRQTSPKTGKPILINTHHWKKSELLDLIYDSGYVKDCIEYINTNFRTLTIMKEYVA